MCGSIPSSPLPGSSSLPELAEDCGYDCDPPENITTPNSLSGHSPALSARESSEANEVWTKDGVIGQNALGLDLGTDVNDQPDMGRVIPPLIPIRHGTPHASIPLSQRGSVAKKSSEIYPAGSLESFLAAVTPIAPELHSQDPMASPTSNVVSQSHRVVLPALPLLYPLPTIGLLKRTKSLLAFPISTPPSRLTKAVKAGQSVLPSFNRIYGDVKDDFRLSSSLRAVTMDKQICRRVNSAPGRLEGVQVPTPKSTRRVFDICLGGREKAQRRYNGPCLIPVVEGVILDLPPSEDPVIEDQSSAMAEDVSPRFAAARTPVNPPEREIPLRSIRPTAIRWAASVRVITPEVAEIPRGIHSAAERHLHPSTLPLPGPSILRPLSDQKWDDRVGCWPTPDRRASLPLSVPNSFDPEVAFLFPANLTSYKPSDLRSWRDPDLVEVTREVLVDPPSDWSAFYGEVPPPRKHLARRVKMRGRLAQIQHRDQWKKDLRAIEKEEKMAIKYLRKTQRRDQNKRVHRETQS